MATITPEHTIHQPDPDKDGFSKPQAEIEQKTDTLLSKFMKNKIALGATAGTLATAVLGTAFGAAYYFGRRDPLPEGQPSVATASANPGGEKSSAKSETEIRVEKAITESGMKAVVLDQSEQSNWKSGSIDTKSRVLDARLNPEIAKFITYLDAHQNITNEELNALASMIFLDGANDPIAQELIAQSRQRAKDGILEQPTVVTVCNSYKNELSGRCTNAERSGIETIESKNSASKISYTVTYTNDTTNRTPKASGYIATANNRIGNVYAGQLLIGA